MSNVPQQSTTIGSEVFEYPAGYKSIEEYMDTLKLNIKLMSRKPSKYAEMIKRDQAELDRYNKVA